MSRSSRYAPDLRELAIDMRTVLERRDNCSSE
jgi:hypothetical protein